MLWGGGIFYGKEVYDGINLVKERVTVQSLIARLPSTSLIFFINGMRVGLLRWNHQPTSVPPFGMANVFLSRHFHFKVLIFHPLPTPTQPLAHSPSKIIRYWVFIYIKNPYILTKNLKFMIIYLDNKSWYILNIVSLYFNLNDKEKKTIKLETIHHMNILFRLFASFFLVQFFYFFIFSICPRYRSPQNLEMYL